MKSEKKLLRICLESIFYASTVTATVATVKAEPFAPGCKEGGYDQPRQRCDVTFSRAKLNSKAGDIVTYRFSSGYTVKRFIAADFTFELAKSGRRGENLTDWFPVSWVATNPNMNECSLIYKDTNSGRDYPMVTTACGE